MKIKEKFIIFIKNTFLVLYYCLIFFSIILFLHLLFYSSVILTSIFFPIFLGFIITFFKNKINVFIVIYTFLIYYTILITVFILVFLRWTNLEYNFYVKFYDLFYFEEITVSFDIFINKVTVFMLLVVLFISYCVSVYSIWYMYKDPNFLKFLSYLCYFSFFMILLVTANNLVFVFVGWEGIGIYSYLLINFWYTRLSANRSALKAIILNKIGDCFLYLFLFLYWLNYKSFNIYESTSNIPSFQPAESLLLWFNFYDFMTICLITASLAKSAQLILHVWLADAMEGPTPVSALLHAATMVTAGAYILIKFNHIVIENTFSQNFILWFGLLTNLVASLTAINQYDVKKVIAYSTASQIGIIFISCGLTKYDIALFHLFNHAFFKALLFILAGYLIHACFNKQDLRNIKNTKKNGFFVYVSFLISSLTLMGIPYFSAYYSKEMVLNNSFYNSYFSGYLDKLLLLLSVASTVVYTLKMLNFLFYSNSDLLNKEYVRDRLTQYDENFLYKNKVFIFKHINLSILCNLICILLIVCSVFCGYIYNEYYINSFFNFFEINQALKNEASYILYFSEVSIVFILYIIFNSFFIAKCADYLADASVYIKHLKFISIITKKFLFNEVYYFIVNIFILFCYFLSDCIEKSFINPVISKMHDFMSWQKNISYKVNKYFTFKMFLYILICMIIDGFLMWYLSLPLAVIPYGILWLIIFSKYQKEIYEFMDWNRQESSINWEEEKNRSYFLEYQEKIKKQDEYMEQLEEYKKNKSAFKK